VTVDLVQVSEEKALAAFWELSGRPGCDRLALLQEMSRVEVPRPDRWSQERVRELSRTSKQNTKIDKCFSCLNADRQIHWHHVIWVSHGGSEALANQVPICRRCHAAIHPWLEVEPDKKYSTWASVSAMAEEFKKKWESGQEEAS
jgi:hypothetical protein